MADSLNFGPEWLRNLSSEGAPNSGPKHLLAEFRYGREEMLALYDKNSKPPEVLSKCPELFNELKQSPVCFTQMTPEENAILSEGLNCDVPPPRPTGLTTALRGRGGSVDRGRGRGRSFYYPRPGFEDPELSKEQPGTHFLRTSRSFDRNQQIPLGERGWQERNGGDPATWNGATSPRKEYAGLGAVRGNHGNNTSASNWRRQRPGASGTEEDDGWRQKEAQKWARSSWREEGAEPGGDPGTGGGPKPNQGGRNNNNWTRGWSDVGGRGRESDHDPRRMDEVPEWATADSNEPSGTFDASGAFHGSGSDEDELFHSDGGGISSRMSHETSKSAREAPTTPTQTPHLPEKSASSAALSEAQSLDRIRAQHQNFVTKVDGAKDGSNQKPSATGASSVDPEKHQPPETQTVDLSHSSHHTKANVDKIEAVRQNSEDDISRLTVDSVVKLIEDEVSLPAGSTASASTVPVPGANASLPTPNNAPLLRPPTETDKWFYRDPNGVEQGAFSSAEMHNWFTSGYFKNDLLVRREHEDRYTLLGQLMSVTGRIPFFPHTPLPPSPAVEGYPYLLGGMPRVKLPEADLWHAMPPAEREAFLRQKLAMTQQPHINPVSRLLSQFQSAIPMQSGLDAADPVRALMMMGTQPQPPQAHPLMHPNLQHNLPHNVVPNSVLPDMTQEEALQRVLLRKLETTSVQQRPIIDSLWSGPGRPAHPVWANGLPNVQPGSGVPLGMGPNARPMKTEDEILAEQQQIRIAAEEAQRKKEQEEQQRRLRLEEEERQKREREEEERRRKEEESLRVILGLPTRSSAVSLSTADVQSKGSLFHTQQQLQKERELEEKTIKLIEEQKRKLAEMKVLEEAQQKKKEEKEKRKEEERERKRLAEEEKKRKEELKKKQEREAEEARRQEEQAQQQLEQQRRQEEALRCLREQQMKSRVKTWGQSSLPPSSLADIQAQERERKLQQQRDLMMNQILASEQSKTVAEEKSPKSNTGLNLKWASAPAERPDQVKSLAEIQIEEQLQLAKQMEKDRLKRQQRAEVAINTGGIWGSTAAPTWNNTNSSGGSVWGAVAAAPPAPATGIWGDSPAPGKAKAKTPTSPVKAKPQQQQNANGTKKTVGANTNNKTAKPKAKREEAAVMKLFEPQDDPLLSWCLVQLDHLSEGLDVNTFCSFLRGLSDPSEVMDYVKTYVGTGIEAVNFAQEFVERRSQWRAAGRVSRDEDELCAPAPAINPSSGDSQDASRKGKKSKKGKMVRVDTRILGFNVTSAPNRINVGERETWES